MSDTEIITILREYLWAGVWIASPMLITALVVGIAIGLFQALTSIQELTITFVPKLIAILVAFTLCANFASQLMLSLFNNSIIDYISR